MLDGLTLMLADDAMRSTRAQFDPVGDRRRDARAAARQTSQPRSRIRRVRRIFVARTASA